VNSNILLLPLYCFRCSITCSFTMKNVYVNSNILLLPLYCFRCSITCNFTMKNVHVNSYALLLPLCCYRCSITLFLHRLICVTDVWCARRGLPLKKRFAWMKDFAWQSNVPSDCRTVPSNVILHSVVSLRPFVSLVTYVLRTRTPSTVISCPANIFTLYSASGCTSN